VGRLLGGPWGVGEGAHIVLSHGAPRFILDTVTGGFNCASGEQPLKKGGMRPCGCDILLRKLRQVRPLLAAFGHVHAEQGLDWLRFRAGSVYKQWRKEGRLALQNKQPYPELPPDAPRRGPMRVAHGSDLSATHAGAPLEGREGLAKAFAEGGPGPVFRAALEKDFANTMFVNASAFVESDLPGPNACLTLRCAASLNATVSMHQHGLEPDEQGGMRVAEGRRQADASSRLRTLRPPIVVDVYPALPGEPGKGRAVLVPLGVERFPET